MIIVIIPDEDMLNLKDQLQLLVYLENFLNSLLGTYRYMKGYLDFWNKSAR